MTSASAGDGGARPIPVMILNYDGWDETFANIAHMDTYLAKLWLIDNGSTVDRCDEATRRFPSLRVIRLEKNGGWAAGYNHALRIAANEGYAHAYLLNSDAIAEPGAVERAVSAFHEGVAAVGSVILSPTGTVSFAGEYWFFLGGRERASLRPPDGVVSVRTLHGAGVAISLNAFETLGPFPEDHFLYWEEAEWFIGATQRGWTLLLHGASLVRHRGEGSGSGDNATYYRTRNRFIAWRRGVPISGRRETWLDLIEEQLRIQAWATPSQWVAARMGLIDGILGRGGARRAVWPAMIAGTAVTLLRALVLPKKAVRRLIGQQ